MSIYPSKEVMPYVYWLTHKETGQFYIGFRSANKIPAEQDLPIYRSSSNKVAELSFENFEWKIVAEFSDGLSAYEFEQALIYENIKNPLCLNKHYVLDGKRKFSTLGKTHSEETRNKLSIANKNKAPRSQEVRDKISESLAKAKKGKESCMKGKTISDEHKAKISAAIKAKHETDPCFNR